jgi:hypothetical protein
MVITEVPQEFVEEMKAATESQPTVKEEDKA